MFAYDGNFLSFRIKKNDKVSIDFHLYFEAKVYRNGNLYKDFDSVYFYWKFRPLFKKNYVIFKGEKFLNFSKRLIKELNRRENISDIFENLSKKNREKYGVPFSFASFYDLEEKDKIYIEMLEEKEKEIEKLKRKND